jgi:hypothetical protein
VAARLHVRRRLRGTRGTPTSSLPCSAARYIKQLDSQMRNVDEVDDFNTERVEVQCVLVVMSLCYSTVMAVLGTHGSIVPVATVLLLSWRSYLPCVHR